MNLNELHTRILGAKQFLNNEMVRLKTNQPGGRLALREINDRLDMIHEVERIGYRNLDEKGMRKINNMLRNLDAFKPSSN